MLQKLTDNYRQSGHPDTFFFEFLSAYFPNLSACVKQNETPKLTLAFEQPYNQSYSSLLLSLRQDYFDDLGAAFVSDTVNRLSQHIGATLRLHKQRPYAYPVASSHGAWTDSIQDLRARWQNGTAENGILRKHSRTGRHFDIQAACTTGRNRAAGQRGARPDARKL